MLATYVQEGNQIDFVPDDDVAAGDVLVLGDLVAVAWRAIKAGELGSLVVGDAVFDLPKTAGAGTAIPFGSRVFWDEADEVAKTDDETGANKYLGKTAKAAGDDDTAVRVRLSQ